MITQKCPKCGSENVWRVTEEHKSTETWTERTTVYLVENQYMVCQGCKHRWDVE